MFIDRAIIEVRSGKGGDGRIAFRRERSRPKGGPSGGNGGRGGSIYLVASSEVNTLVKFRHSKVFVANDGENGDIKDMYGHSADDVYISLPVGTVVFLEENKQFICDLDKPGKTVLIAKGGRGGRGNAAFKSNRYKTPKIAENGLPGEKKRLILELKLLADVGIIGYPSVGKSTFINLVSNAKAEVGDYGFTTTIPNLGVTYLKDGSSFVIADMPGLIKGAHLGKGLGLVFLRHIERTRVLIHMVDMSGLRDPYQDYLSIRSELKDYGMHLIDRPEVIVASKMDEEGAQERFKEFQKKVNKEVIPITALDQTNFDLVLYRCKDLLKDAKTYPVYEESNEEVVINAYDKDERIFYIEKINENTYEIKGERVLRTYNLINISTDDGMMRLITYLNKIGVDEELHKLGAKDGDIVKISDFEFEYFE
ncbi:MAG: GTPase ObgE [Firmicutes bacterium]|uniref:GTPase Obg n=1 Tax=Candidatus Onthovivens merdipullorum TaxID=2840889 RepID=A0A9D9DJB0_9BACL|nr:GTPase ObgE [Candidatus Onthovivens merdipullorum]